MSEAVRFCQRNIKLWLSALVVLALFVLGYAFWLAWNRGEISGFAVQESGGAAGTGGAVGAGGPLPQPGPQPGQVALQAAPVANQMLAAQGVAFKRQLDAISRATPNGGIQFIGGGQQTWQAPTIQTAFNQSADVIRPTVVNVNAVRPGTPPAPAPANPNVARFIDPFDGVPDKIIGQMAYDSVGSGVIVDPRGYVITNNHVVAGASSVVVTRFNEPQNFLTARIVAVDTNNDLAMLQIMAPGPFPTASLADSSLTEVGDWVIAVGNPFGLEHTVTAGIISARRSSIAIDSMVYNGLLQTDAPINRGSSGGPLCNLQGRVIGINTAIYAPTGVFNGTGFAIPSNRVSAFVAKVLSNPAATAGLPVALLGSHMTTRALQATAVQQVAMQPQLVAGVPGMQPGMQPGAQQGPPAIWLGIGVVDMTPDLAKRLGFPYAGGVFVNSVILDSPADEAQFTRGDILISASGAAIANADTLNQVFATMKPGVPVIFTFWRGGKTETTQLTPQASRPIGR